MQFSVIGKSRQENFTNEFVLTSPVEPSMSNLLTSSIILLFIIWFGLVWFYSISTIVGYLIPNPLYTYILHIYEFGWVLWHINHYRLFNAKSSLCIYITNI